MPFAVISGWGNSLGVRLPRAVAESVGLREGDRVCIDVQDGSVIIRPAKPRYTLNELLAGTTPEMLRSETQVEGIVGAEDVW